MDEKIDSAAKDAKGAKGGRATSSAAIGNVSKVHRERLLAEVAAIKSFLERSGDTNATRLLSFAADLEKEVRGKKFGLIFEEHRERVDAELEANIPILEEVKERFVSHRGTEVQSPLNFLIEGDNLAALKLLEKTHRGKIDLIYIDPPYNTGNNGNKFIYNDSYIDKIDTFRHSKWLSFMKKRLECMRSLMSREAYLCISIDDNELYSLKMLCDEIFNEENLIACIPRRTKSSGKTTKDISSNHDYVLIYARDNEHVLIGGLAHIDAGFRHEDEFVDKRGKYKLNQTLDYDSLQYSRGLDYPIELDGEVFYPGQDKVAWER
ncbi:MAG: site-specific DNA-methyltransferase, partial [Kiritimatiellae bacterium]|nr:site-specific DNA-methyltransferase [Kiritimatiellia bacterium]